MMNKIALRSFQSELSHLSAFPLLTNSNALLTKLLFIIMFAYHAHRYIKYFSDALLISKNQSNIWYLNILDYSIIIIYQLILSKKSNNYTFGIISGIISFYFIYIEHRGKQNFSNNHFIDLFISIVLIWVFIYEKNNKIRFFVVRDLTYHLLEFFVFY